MDCSWLVEDDINENPESESDPEETQAELENRLYSIVHHSDLSQPLPPELAKHYSVQCGDDGKLTVALNDSLENIKSEEVKQVDYLVKDSETDNEVSELVEIDSSPEKNDVIYIFNDSFNPEKNSHKRFRYSDINLDLSDKPFKISETYQSLSSDINYSDYNYFNISQTFLRKKKIRKLRLAIPASFQTDQSCNSKDTPDWKDKASWKDAANESFISVGADSCDSEKQIIDKMVCALSEVNPKEGKGKLYFLARALFLHNRKKHRKQLRRKQRSKVVDKTLDSSLEEKSEFVKYDSKDSCAEHSKTIKNNGFINFEGSVSLNISPFKPLPSSQRSQPSIVDLISEDEVDHSAIKTTKKWKSLPKCEIPRKWTKKMSKYYTKPSSRKLTVELNTIFEDLKRSSTKDDWKVDPRDEKGVYQQIQLKGKHRNRRCPNCRQKGHLLYDCPSPRKAPCCFLCGQIYHTVSSCPNRVCNKCGDYAANEECNACYYHSFNYDTPCELCGQITHRSEICPDLWRSFHATVEGDKKIPEQVLENPRKYCCNCATKGHFSHQCPHPAYDGEKTSFFVINYSASPKDDGISEVIVPRYLSYIIDTDDANRFLQHLSNSTQASITVDVDDGERDYVFQIRGTFQQCTKVRSEIEDYVNTKKRKRQEPFAKRKRRRMN